MDIIDIYRSSTDIFPMVLLVKKDLVVFKMVLLLTFNFRKILLYDISLVNMGNVKLLDFSDS